MSKFMSTLIVEEIDSKYIRLVEPLLYYSSILKRTIVVQKGFVCDRESVPIIKGTSSRAGIIHDYLCRYDSSPKVTKQVAASVYHEAMALRDSALEESWFTRNVRFVKRWIKSTVVRVAWGYFHKLSVYSTFEEVADS